VIITYINDPFPENKFCIRTRSICDDISVIISSRNFEDFCSVSNLVLSCMIKLFSANQLVLNLDKTNKMKSITNNPSYSALHIGYKEQYIEETVNTKFLGLQMDNHPKWISHTEPMIPKLSEACYAVTSMGHITSINTLKSIYYEYFHSVKKYRILFGGNSSNRAKIFTLQKKNHQNYGWYTTQNFMYQSIKKIRDSTCSMPIYIFIN